jgi:signal transduction histidine kinase
VAANRTTSLANLSSPDRLVRLDAARSLARQGTRKDRAVIVQALNREGDPTVRRALGSAIQVLGDLRTPMVVAELPLGRQIDDLRAQVTQEVSDQLLHEVRHIVGGARLAAVLEVPNYGSSGTKRELDRLSDLLDVLAQLNRAATAPTTLDEFDLAELLATLARDALGPECDLDKLTAGPHPMLVTAPQGALKMIITNGLRNAVESVGSRDRPPCDGIVLNWGTTDSEYWVAILDDGIGLPDTDSRLFDAGYSTKAGADHFGLGLTIARRAARSLGGEISLRSREASGAIFEIRWPSGGVNDEAADR